MRISHLILRLVALALVAGLAAVMFVDGVLIRRLGSGVPQPGRIIAVTPPADGAAEGVIELNYEDLSGAFRDASCRVPAAALAGYAPGQKIDVFARSSIRDTYVCVREGMDRIHRQARLPLAIGAIATAISLIILIGLARAALRAIAQLRE